jgi:hypothetical protein
MLVTFRNSQTESDSLKPSLIREGSSHFRRQAAFQALSWL